MGLGFPWAQIKFFPRSASMIERSRKARKFFPSRIQNKFLCVSFQTEIYQPQADYSNELHF